MKRIFALTLAGFLVAASASAQKDLAKERISLQFKDVAIAQALPALAKSLGYEVTLDPNLHAMLTLLVENVTPQTALNAICESVGCRWRQSGKQLIIEARTDIVAVIRPTPKSEQLLKSGANPMGLGVRNLDERLPYDITWAPADVELAFTVLARMDNAVIDVAPAVSGRKLAVKIENATLRQAFDAVCALASCRWELVEQPKRVVRVADREAGFEAPTVYDRNTPGVTPPTAITRFNPSYTKEAMQAKLQGRVVISCVVQPDGSVTDVQVTQSLDPGLDDSAIKAVRRWVFQPAMKDGRPVPFHVDLDMTFTLR